MGKTVKVLVVLYFLLSLVVLWQTTVLLGQKQELKGRMQNLERTFVRLGSTLEVDEPSVDRPPRYAARDIDETNARELADPNTSDFWDNYKHQLELTDREKLDLAAKAQQLKKYYQVDPMTGARVPYDFGVPAAAPGTMHEVLDNVIKLSGDQLSRLNATRFELVKLRKELADTIADVNQKKQDLRLARQKLVESDAKLVQMENTVGELNRQVATRDARITALNGDISRLDDELAQRGDKIKDNEQQITFLREKLQGRPGAGTIATGAYGLPRGTKGSVIAASADWSYALIKLTPAIIEELMAFEGDEPIEERVRNLEMLVRRSPEEGGGYVAKIKLRELKLGENVAVADVLIDWQSAALHKGDVVYY